MAPVCTDFGNGMSAPPAVSVLMTAFNREPHIALAIESVLAQTFGDFELIVVDDRSGDRTVDIARSYEPDPRVRVVVNDRNLGDYPNRNRAAALARGAFLKYHDSDDLMYPHCLETMVGMLRAAPGAGFGMSTRTSWPGGPCPMLLTPRMSYQREFLGSGLFMCGPAGALFRATVFAELGGFPDAGVGSDYLFWLEACAKVCVALMPADLFWYRVHAGQEIQTDRAAREYAVAAGAAWLALNAAKCPLTAAEREQAKRNWAFTLARGAWREVRARRWGVAAAQLRHAGLRWRDWALYLRPPLREPHAGTPLDRDGEYVVTLPARAVGREG
ncbi:MAG: glycosyltransferase family 2 protein [Candidatus Rokubacteria bacterium]|nr:glycosyltransferase family 2 protein [Candidatus Rokubacteria bacterium]